MTAETKGNPNARELVVIHCTYNTVKSGLEQVHDILTGYSSSCETLGPVDESSLVDAGLVNWERKCEAEFRPSRNLSLDKTIS